MAREDRRHPVDLLGEHDSGKPVWERHGAEGNHLVGLGKDAEAESVRTADEQRLIPTRRYRDSFAIRRAKDFA